MGLWLTRSGQAWKTRTALCAAYSVFPLIALCLAALHVRWGGVLAAGCLLLAAAGAANLALPLTVRCRVCRLQIETCRTARGLSRGKRLLWVQSLERCPACGDDGLANMESRRVWEVSGHPQEPRYWSAWRFTLAVVMTVALAIFLAITLRYRVKR